MKIPTTMGSMLTHAFAAVFAIAVASTARAADPLVAFADFNNDGLVDVATVTNPTTITVSLANPDGSYTVSAILSAPKSQKITSISLSDRDGDGDLDLYANCPAGGGWIFTSIWLSNGDGTFGPRTTAKWSWPPKGNYGSW